MTKNNKTKEWKKVESEVFTFEQIGDELEGKLISKSTAPLGNGLYKVKTEDHVYTVFGTTILDSKLEFVEVGSEVKIAYMGEQPNKKPGQSDIKLFDVWSK